MPDWVGTKNRFVVTWLTNQNFHAGVFGKLPAALVYAATKLLYAPVNRSRLGRRVIAPHLFYNDYLSAIAPFGWREQHTIVFDHLVAPVAFYLPRAEFAAWWQEIDAEEVTITWHNRNSWCGFGRIK